MKKQLKMSKFDQVQKKLDKLATIKLKCDTSIILTKSKTAKHFIENFFKKYNLKYATVYTTINRIQTFAGKTRSAHDLYRITKFYFPQTTYEDIHKILEKYALKGQLVGECCSTVREHVYSIITAHTNWGLLNVVSHGHKFQEPKLYTQFVQEADSNLSSYHEKDKSRSAYENKLKSIYKKKKKLLSFVERY